METIAEPTGFGTELRRWRDSRRVSQLELAIRAVHRGEIFISPALSGRVVEQYLDSAPWLAIVPGAAITLAVTSFNFIGDGLRDALDARSDML